MSGDEPGPPTPRSWVPGSSEGPVPSGLTSLRPATEAKPQRTLWAVLGMLAVLAASAGYVKWRQSTELQREYEAQSSESAPLRLPAAAEPPKEMPGILPDSAERGASVQAPATLPEDWTQPPAQKAPPPQPPVVPEPGAAKDLPALEKFKSDPRMQELARSLSKDPAILAAAKGFERDHDAGKLLKTLNDNPVFRQNMDKFMSDPKFAGLLAGMGPQARAVLSQAAKAPVRQAPAVEPAADPAGGPDTVDPLSVSGQAPGARADAPAPPPPKRR